MILLILHRAAGIAVAAFVCLHIANHLVALVGVSSHIAFMMVARLVYRQPAIGTGFYSHSDPGIERSAALRARLEAQERDCAVDSSRFRSLSCLFPGAACKRGLLRPDGSASGHQFLLRGGGFLCARLTSSSLLRITFWRLSRCSRIWAAPRMGSSMLGRASCGCSRWCCLRHWAP